MNRLETGAIQCGDDWPGVFIRGDNAMNYGMLLKKALEKLVEIDPLTAMQLSSLAGILSGCNATDCNPTQVFVSAPEWQPIETAPKDGTYVIIHVYGHPVSAIAAWVNNDDYTGWAESSDCEFEEWPCDGWEPTHWVPLPEPPK